MRYWTIALPSLLAVLLGGAATAQSTREGTRPDTAAVAALTAEIRALRTELADAARTSLRLQLLTARIQAQEQRIIYLDRQRVDAAARRGTAEAEQSSVAAQLRRLSEADRSKLATEERPAFDAELAATKGLVADAERRVQQARAEESDATNALAQEQSRWADLNARLDDLDRTLNGR